MGRVAIMQASFRNQTGADLTGKVHAFLGVLFKKDHQRFPRGQGREELGGWHSDEDDVAPHFLANRFHDFAKHDDTGYNGMPRKMPSH